MARSATLASTSLQSRSEGIYCNVGSRCAGNGIFRARYCGGRLCGKEDQSFRSGSRRLARYRSVLGQIQAELPAPTGTVFYRCTSRWPDARSVQMGPSAGTASYIYGMKLSQALRLVELLGGDQLDVCELTDKQLHTVAYGLPSIEHLRIGMNYLGCKVASSTGRKEDSTTMVRRPMISQQDGKTAFNAILIHLTKWNDGVQVFPCGSFSRGAAFISVLDILVALPTPEDDPERSEAQVVDKTFDDVAVALTTANVIQKGVIRRLSGTRGVCIIPFKNNSILLDLKVYCPPRSWLALLYFTGPEDFILAFFTELLKRSLREIPDTSFECIYASVAEVLGQEALLEITSEKDLFDIVDRDYVQPTDRI